MPRKKKIKRILFSIAALIGIGLGGFAVHQHQEKQKMIEIATSKEARKVYVAKFRREDPSAFKSDGIIQSYEIDEDSLDYNPMGGLMVRVTVNQNKSAFISFNLMDNGDGTYHSAYYIVSAKLDDMLEENR
ncbi:DUF1310 family protein [Streptococcus pantholopis]|uniref:DUF1310 domain-containing protein n=1 Tax=Streptococcus pantholopis TaxID=1811193 RepID=A0A172Q5Q6_9STRE|nr:DUF1310 family protein [Streptococcus pantholopis]AND78776.1 hypothetical protein A0O21_01370 [Streptococcus pantholopis]